LNPVRDLPEVAERLRADSLFPLGSGWYAQRVGSLPDFRPRDLLTWAGERWQRLQEGAASLPAAEWLARWPAVPLGKVREAALDLAALVDRKVDEKLAECIAQRRREPASLPPDEDHLARLVFGLLRSCAAMDGAPGLREVVRPNLPRSARAPYDLLLRHQDRTGAELRTGVRFLVAHHGNQTTTALRWLLEDARPPQRVFLVSDARVPLPLGRVGREHLAELQRRGPARFRMVELSLEEYLALEALQAVIRLARSGDLEVEFPPGQRRPVSEAEVIASHLRRQRYHARPLLRDLLGKSGCDASEEGWTIDEIMAREG
jgi:hypothetical protein